MSTPISSGRRPTSARRCWPTWRAAASNPSAWGDVGERHLETTLAADVAVVFGLQAQATGWNIPNDAVAAHVARRRNACYSSRQLIPPAQNSWTSLSDVTVTWERSA